MYSHTATRSPIAIKLWQYAKRVSRVSILSTKKAGSTHTESILVLTTRAMILVIVLSVLVG